MRHVCFKIGIGIGLLAGAGCAVDEDLGKRQLPPHPALFASQPRWEMTYGTADNETGRAITFDSTGDVLVGGYVFDGSTATEIHPDRNGGFVTKRAGADGAERWTRRLMGPATRVTAIATAPGDGVIVAGGFAGHSDFAGQTLDVGTAAPLFVARYDRDGALQWVRDYTDDGATHATAVAVAPDGSSYVTGSVIDPATFPSEVDTTIGVGVVLAYTPAGDLAWSRRFPGVLPVAIALTRDGDLVIDATIGGPAAFGGAPLTPLAMAGGRAPQAQVVARFHASGEPVWSRLFSRVDAYVGAKAIATLGDQLVVASSEHDLSDIGAVATVRVLDGDGLEQWSQRPLSKFTQMEALTTTAHGAIVTGGCIATTAADFGTGPIDAWGMYIMAYDADGTPAEVRAPRQAWSTTGIASHGESIAAVGEGTDAQYEPLPDAHGGVDLRIVVLDPAE